MFHLTKRRKFILSSLALTAGLVFTQFGYPADRYLVIGILSFFSILLVFWSLSEALHGATWLVSWILPLMFTAGIGFFYFLLPTSIFTAVPVIIFYFVGMYVLFLNENIFAVAAIRTIQLYRSASAVSFLLTLFTSFLLYDTVFSFRFPFYLNAPLVLIISFLLFIHGVWSVNLEEKISIKLFSSAFLLSVVMAEIAFVLSFWPTTIALNSLFLTSLVYVLLGLVQAQLSGRLFKRTVEEYLVVGVAVLIVLLFYSNWG